MGCFIIIGISFYHKDKRCTRLRLQWEGRQHLQERKESEWLHNTLQERGAHQGSSRISNSVNHHVGNNELLQTIHFHVQPGNRAEISRYMARGSYPVFARRTPILVVDETLRALDQLQRTT